VQESSISHARLTARPMPFCRRASTHRSLSPESHLPGKKTGGSTRRSSGPQGHDGRASRYLPKYFGSSDRHDAFAVISIRARSRGFLSGEFGGSANAI